jgi:hypothetical protein
VSLGGQSTITLAVLDESDNLSVFSRKGPHLFKTFPPDLSSRLSARQAPSEQRISVYTFAS